MIVGVPKETAALERRVSVVPETVPKLGAGVKVAVERGAGENAGFPDSDFDFWIGMVVPKRTPRDIIARIHQETVNGLKDPAVKEKLAKLGVEDMIMQPEDFDARIAREAPIAMTLAKAAGIAAK